MKHKCFRNSSDWDNFGTGDRLLIQKGEMRNNDYQDNPLIFTDDLINIPLTQAEADKTLDW